MPKFIDIRVVGGKRLNKKFNKLDTKVKGKIMREATKTAMQPVLELAKNRAPVKTGLMRRSLKIASFRGRNAVGAVVRTGTRRQLKILANAKGYYPAAVEYGTRKLRARPFMRSSLAARKPQALSILGREIKAMLRRA